MIIMPGAGNMSLYFTIIILTLIIGGEKCRACLGEMAVHIPLNVGDGIFRKGL